MFTSALRILSTITGGLATIVKAEMAFDRVSSRIWDKTDIRELRRNGICGRPFGCICGRPFGCDAW